MDNLLLLSKQFLRPIKIMLIVVDSLWVLYIAFLVMMRDNMNDLLEVGWSLGGLLIAFLILNLLFFEAKKPERISKNGHLML